MSTWEDDVIPERNEDSLGVVGKVFIIILLILHLCLAVSLIHVRVRDLKIDSCFHPGKNKRRMC